jgi:hypothetical protein
MKTENEKKVFVSPKKRKHIVETKITTNKKNIQSCLATQKHGT